MTYYKLRQFAMITGLSEAQLRYWDKTGKLIACRKPNGIRFYTYDHLLQFCFGDSEMADELLKGYNMDFVK